MTRAVQKNVDRIDLEKMLQNDPSLAIVAVHTAENEPLKLWGYSFSFSVTSLAGSQLRMGLEYPQPHTF
jgi:hypothetical protein